MTQTETGNAVVVSIDQLIPGHSPRSGGEDSAHIAALVESSPSTIPAIVVHRATMQVIDGMHRLRAAELRGCRTITVEFFDGSVEEAFLFSVAANVRHGLPLPLADRKAAARRILATKPEMSDRAVAEVTGLAARTVAGVRRAVRGAPVAARTGADGRRRPVDPFSGRRRARELLVASPDLTVRALAEQAGISLGTAHAVRKEFLDGDPAGPSLPPAPSDRPGVDTGDPEALMNRLRADPVVRFNDSGRRLIRSLQAASVNVTDLVALSAEVPEHCAPLVSRLAVRQAALWAEFARRVTVNSGDDTTPIREISV